MMPEEVEAVDAAVASTAVPPPPGDRVGMILENQAHLPLEARSFGPILVWAGTSGKTPNLLFRPTRFSTEELADPTPRSQSAAPWHLSVVFYRTESKLLQTILEDHGFAANGSRSCNLLWCGAHVKPALLMNLREFQKVNHFPAIHDITRKDLMARLLASMRDSDFSEMRTYSRKVMP